MPKPTDSAAHRRFGARLALLAIVATAACVVPAGQPATDPGAARLPRTRAERTSFTETSRYDDVIAFLDSLSALGAPIHRDTIGSTTEGRRIPFVIASRPLVRTPEEARRGDKPVVYVQANIHAGEVEGKEALQALLRDLVFAPRPNVLDSVVLIAVPIYNADGNERFAPQARNRGSQNGPEMVGQRSNAQSLDLNRDYIKADAPETRASLRMFDTWDPDVFVDLHTTNGSYHGYALTYSASLNPAADVRGGLDGGGYARDSLLPVLRRRMRERHRFETFDYGNFVSNDSVSRGWFTYDHSPRFGTNYYALRGRISVLSEAYSHDPFDRRVASTYAFVSELLSLVAERGRDIRARARRADSLVASWGERPASAPPVPIRAALTSTPVLTEVIVERLERAGDSTRTEPGVPPGIRRTGDFQRMRIPVYDRLVPTLSRPLPWAYVLAPGDSAGVRLLRAHGITVDSLGRACTGQHHSFAIDSTIVSPRAFQGRRTVRLEGRWFETRSSLPANAWLVRSGQPLGVLAAYLLEPESDDGLTAWNVDDRATTRASALAIVRLERPLAESCGG